MAGPAASPWDHPPSHFLDLLVEYIGPRDWVALQLVCRAWRQEARLTLKSCTPKRHDVSVQALVNAYPNLTHLDLVDVEGLNLSVLAHLQHLTNLKELDLGDVDHAYQCQPAECTSPYKGRQAQVKPKRGKSKRKAKDADATPATPPADQAGPSSTTTPKGNAAGPSPLRAGSKSATPEQGQGEGQQGAGASTPQGAGNGPQQSGDAAAATPNRVVLSVGGVRAASTATAQFRSVLRRLEALRTVMSPAITPAVLSELTNLGELGIECLPGLDCLTPLTKLTYLDTQRLPSVDQLSTLTSIRRLTVSSEWLDLSTLLAAAAPLPHLKQFSVRSARAPRDSRAPHAPTVGQSVAALHSRAASPEPPVTAFDWNLLKGLQNLELRACVPSLTPELPSLHCLAALTHLSVELCALSGVAAGAAQPPQGTDGVGSALTLNLPPALVSLVLTGDKGGVNNQEIALHIHPDSVLEQCTLRLYWNKLKIVLPEAVCIPTPATSPSPRRVSGGAQARGQDVGEMPGSGGDDADRGRGAAAAAASPPSPQTLRRSTRRAARASGGGGGANPTDTAAPAAGPAAAQAPAASPSNTHTTHTTRRSAGANRSTRDRLPAVAGGDEASEAGGPSSHEPATNRPETAGNAPANAESDEDLSGSCTTLPGFERLHSVVLDACFTLFPLQGGTSSEGLTRVVPLLSVLHGSRVADLRLDDGLTVSDEDLWAIVSNMRQITHLAVVGCNKITDAGLMALGHLPKLYSVCVAGLKDIGCTAAQAYARPQAGRGALAKATEKVTGGFLTVLAGLRALRHVNFSHLHCVQKSSLIKGLSQLTKLRWLELSDVSAVSDEVLTRAVIPHLTNLTQLTVTHCQGVSEEGRVAALAAWGMRVGLTFDGCRVTDITRPRHRHAQAGAAVQGSSALAEAMSE